MGDPKGFMKVGRKESGYRPVGERVRDFSEVEQILGERDRREQASRCMDCGVPFCHWACPIMNRMPEWQDAVYRGDFKKAVDILHETNGFPEITGRVCPALCEMSCVLNIHEEPVTIRENECSVAEKAFELGHIQPSPPEYRTGKRVAVVGSGPAGLSCADLLNKWGHTVTLYEKGDAVGGLMRYGIPDFKLSKELINRRVDIFAEEGLNIEVGVDVGKDIKAGELLKKHDAVCIAIGATHPRDLDVPGRELKGIHFAMDYLTQQNMEVAGVTIPKDEKISAKGKNVVVIGGGDTGSDCVGTAVRQRAKSVTQIEILSKPPEKRSADNPWPYWPNTLRTSSSHKEGCKRMWSLATKGFVGDDGSVKGLETVEVEWKDEGGKAVMVERPGTEKTIDADLVLLSMGFVHPIHEGLADDLKLEYDAMGNVNVDDKMRTSNRKVFAAGDAATGASLVVRAIDSGRNAAMHIDRYLQGLTK
jgi:glutamate synthase (NADPH/NADH) small chain